jgi:hypothetical protein
MQAALSTKTLLSFDQFTLQSQALQLQLPALLQQSAYGQNSEILRYRAQTRQSGVAPAPGSFRLQSKMLKMRSTTAAHWPALGCLGPGMAAARLLFIFLQTCFLCMDLQRTRKSWQL